MFRSTLKLSDEMRTKLCNVSNENSILVEFVRDNSLATGFTAWLSDENKEQLPSLILEESEIIISWPCCDVQSASSMKKNLKTVNFKKQVVKIISSGDWIEMRRQMKNMLETGELNVSKNSRKRIKKKNHDPTPKKKDVPVAKKLQISKVGKATIRKQQSNRLLAEIMFEKTKNNDGLQGSSSDEDESLNIVKAKKKFSMRLLNNDDNSDTDPVCNQREANKRHVNNEDKLYNTDSEAEPGESEPGSKEDLELNKQKNSSLLLKQLPDLAERESMQQNEQVDETKPSSESDEVKHKINEDTGEKRVFDPWKYANLPLVAAAGMPPLPLNKDLIKSLPKSNAQVYAASLAQNVFTHEELRSHSVTGIAPNSYTQFQVNQVKPALPGRRVMYIFETVTEILGRSTKVDAQIRKGISSKITAARNMSKRRAQRQVNARNAEN